MKLTFPWPSHVRSWQSPYNCELSMVPLGALFQTHFPSVQDTGFLHSVALQSLSSAHSAFPPAPPIPPVDVDMEPPAPLPPIPVELLLLPLVEPVRVNSKFSTHATGAAAAASKSGTIMSQDIRFIEGFSLPWPMRRNARRACPGRNRHRSIPTAGTTTTNGHHTLNLPGQVVGTQMGRW
jgi:hypothetical protein